mgnify:CR=1 FL=1
MDLKFLKTPTNLACLIIAIVYLLPFTPYLNMSSKSGNDKISVSGLQILLGSATIEGDATDKKDEIEDVLFEGMSEGPNQLKDFNLNPMLGLFDKLSFLVLIGALILLYVSYKNSIEEPSPVTNETLRWIKIGMLSLGFVLMIRYLTIPLIMFPVNVIWTIGIGAFLTMFSLVTIYFDNKLK